MNGIKPHCPKCKGKLKITHRDNEGGHSKKFLLCVDCGDTFRIKEWWPVPGEKLTQIVLQKGEEKTVEKVRP